MGADFVFSWVALSKSKETKEILLKEIDNFDIPELSDNPKNKVINALKDTNGDNFEMFCDLWGGGFNGDFDENMPVETSENDEETIITEKRAKEIMKNVVEDFFQSLGNRDMGSFEFKGSEIYLSGGMSYGDNPTDSINIISRINNLPPYILEKAGVE